MSNQPSTPAGPNDDHSTSLLSKFTWPQLKQVSIGRRLLGLRIVQLELPRCSASIGNAWPTDDPIPPGTTPASAVWRMRAAAQTRPCLSIAKLCAVVWLFQIASSPQYGDGCGGGVFAALGVFGSRTVSFTWLAALRVGSTTGM